MPLGFVSKWTLNQGNSKGFCNCSFCDHFCNILFRGSLWCFFLISNWYYNKVIKLLYLRSGKKKTNSGNQLSSLTLLSNHMVTTSVTAKFAVSGRSRGHGLVKDGGSRWKVTSPIDLLHQKATWPECKWPTGFLPCPARCRQSPVQSGHCHVQERHSGWKHQVSRTVMWNIRPRFFVGTNTQRFVSAFFQSFLMSCFSPQQDFY